MILKSLIVWLLIALAETANGIVRVRLLSRPLGNRRARTVSLLSGSIFVFIITWLSMPWIGPGSLGDALLTGLIWMVLMCAYDIGIGRWAFGLKWRAILADFDFRQGNYLALGMLWVLLVPVLVFQLRHAGAGPAGLIEVSAKSDLGFHSRYLLWVPAGVEAVSGNSPTRLLVIPNNTGTPSDDPDVHEAAVRRMLEAHYRHLAENLGVVLLCPVFPRPESLNHIYTHALDRDSLTTEEVHFRRLDLQLNAMQDHAAQLLARKGHTVSPKALIMGFSASGMFANRYTVLHPERILAAAIGSPGGWPIAPVTDWRGHALPYPVGIADVEQITGQVISLDVLKSVPLFLFLGSADENDSVLFDDGYDENQRELVFALFGRSPVDRWEPASAIYEMAGMNAQFRLYPEVEHSVSPEMIADVISFFRQAIMDADQ